MRNQQDTIGIDLGTTNTVAASVIGSDPEIISNRFNEYKTPSVVSFDDSGPIVGRPAKNRAVSHPSKTAQEIKRHIGDESFAVSIQGRLFSPKELSALILKRVKINATNYLGNSVEKAVITVPANFRSKQRQATKTAGEIANLSVEALIDEPTAACAAYGYDSPDSTNETILVFDLGGGTLDISILESTVDGLDVLVAGGNNRLGGKEWDSRIMEWITREHEIESGTDISNDLQARQRIKDSAVKAKHELTTQEQTKISIPFLGGEESFEQVLTREKYESFSRDLVRQAIEVCSEVVSECEHSSNHIDTVILAGGGTRMPQIQSAVSEFFGVDVLSGINPDEVVAQGASILASVQTDQKVLNSLPAGRDNMEINEVITNSLGIELHDRSFDPILSKGEDIPATVTEGPYTTTRNDQTQIEIRVYEGEDSVASNNDLLDKFYLSGIPPAPAGKPMVEVEFSLDSNGILNVKAHEVTTNKKRQITIETALQESEGEIDNIRSDLPSVSGDSEESEKGESGASLFAF